jgi:hypothetical protein
MIELIVHGLTTSSIDSPAPADAQTRHVNDESSTAGLAPDERPQKRGKSSKDRPSSIPDNRRQPIATIHRKSSTARRPKLKRRRSTPRSQSPGTTRRLLGDSDGLVRRWPAVRSNRVGRYVYFRARSSACRDASATAPAAGGRRRTPARRLDCGYFDGSSTGYREGGVRAVHYLGWLRCEQTELARKFGSISRRPN